MAVSVSNTLYNVLIKTTLGTRLLGGIESGKVDFLDIAHVDPRKISYIPKNRLAKFDGDVFNVDLRRKFAVAGRAGKVIGGITNAPPEELTTFVAQYYAELETQGITKEGDIVVTDDFAYYKAEHHFNNNGTLGSSCMKYDECYDNDWFEVYQDFGVKIVLFMKESKVTARALLWQDVVISGRPEKVTFMDRIYTNNSNDEVMLMNYAKSNNWYYKAHQSYDYKTETMCPTGGGEYIESNLNMSVSMGCSINCDHYPYMDTFSYSDDDTFNNTGGDYAYESTDGSRYTPDMEWSEYHQCDMREGEGRYSDHLDSLIWDREAVYCEGINSYMPQDHDDIICLPSSTYWHIDYVTHIERDDEYVTKDEAVYSEYTNEDIKVEDAVEVDNIYVHEDDYDEYIEENKEDDN